MFTILAHGALGAWDEVIFASVAVIFVVMMAISFIKSRNIDPDADDPTETVFSTTEQDSPDHFRLD